MAEKANPISNDTIRLEPHVSFHSPALTLDFSDLHIGIAEYREGPTGCTVFYFPGQASCAIDIRGGLVGVHGDYGRIDALCFAGGSLHGLEAALGVTAELLATQGYRLGCVPLVNGAIVYDPRERLQGLIDHRNMRERQILKVLEDHKPRSSWDIMMEIYPGLDRRLRRAAAGNVETRGHAQWIRTSRN